MDRRAFLTGVLGLMADLPVPLTCRCELMRQAGALLFGEEWQRPLSRALGPVHPDGPRDHIDDRLVRRWAAGTRPIPDWVMFALVELCVLRVRDYSLMATRIAQLIEDEASK